MHLVNVPPHHLFQGLADPIRIRVLRLLAVAREEACLCELVDSLQEPQYTLSRHLKVLRQTGLLSTEKDGRWIYHRLVMTPYLKLIYETIRTLPDVHGTFARDLARFKKRMRLRKDGRCRTGIRGPMRTVAA